MLKNVLKKSVVWLVLVCMLCSFAPVSAFATNEAPNIIIRNDTGVSTRGDVPSGNVSEPSATAPSTDVTIDTEAELVAALAAGQKDILLGGNVTLSATLNVNAQKLCTLDLGGYTLTNENGYAINNTARSLTVSNGTVIGGIQNASTLYVDDDVKVVTNTVNGACVSGSGDNYIYGTLLADAEGAVCINTAGNLEVSGATLTSKQGTAIVFNDTTGTIENSTVVGKTGAISVAKGALTIAGGSFSSEANVVTVNGGNLVINGGTFSGDASVIKDYVAEGASVTIGGTVYTKDNGVLEPVVTVTTYDALVNALANGESVVLGADITATGEVDGTNAVIDLGGYTLTLTVGRSNFYGDSFVSNGTINITGCVASGDCIIGIGDYSNSASLTFNGVNVIGDGYSSAYAVLYVYNASTLNINGGSIVVANDNASAGGVIKAHKAADGKVNITGTAADPVELSFTNAKIGFLDGTVVFDRVDLDIVGGANAINQSLLTVKNSTLDISGCDGRALTLSQGDVTIIASELNFSDCSEGEIRFKKGLELSVDASSKIQPCTVYADTSASGANINGNAVTGTEAKPDTVVVVNGSTGVYAINGTVTPGYAASTYINGVPAIYGEATANPNESLVIKIYCGETLLGTVRLNPEKLSEVFPSAATVTKNVTWHAAFAADGDDYWITEWEENALTSSKVPTSVSLYVDGVKVGDNVVRMSGPDGINPVKWRLLDGVVVDNLEGEGTASNPYLIYNIKDLAFFRDSVNAGNTYNGKYVKVTASEIDLANNEWTPIGYMGKSFQGNFDGNGVTIKNLKITKGLDNTAANNGIGFFGRTDSPATIANITIENVDVSGSLYVGAVVGYGYTGNAVKNVTVKGDIAIDAWWYAGVIGGNGYMSLVDNCHVIGNNGSYIKGNDGSYIGGIWGFRGEGAQKITNCYVKNIDITGVDRVGGISGIAHYGNTISGVTVEGVKVSATDASATTVGLIAGACQGTESEPSVFKNITVTGVTVTIGDQDKTNEVGNFGTNINGSDPVTNYVASVNGTLYDTLTAAIAAAQAGGTVVLIHDVVEVVNVVNGAVVTIDMKGYTLIGSILAPNATLTIKNGKIVNADKGVSALEINAGSLTLDNMSIDSARHALRIDGAVEAVINSGTYRSAIGTGTGTYHALNVSGAANVTINGGSFVGSRGTTADSGIAVNIQTGATATINGGSFTGGRGGKVVSANGTLTIKAGTFECVPDASYVADGYFVSESNGVYTVLKAVASVDGKMYADFAEALKAIKSGSTFVLVDDVTIDSKWDNRYTGAKITVPVTIDGNEHKIIVTGEINDGGNYTSFFRFESNATVNNLTIDLSAATSNNPNRIRAISSKSGNLTVDNCTFIGNAYTNARAIIFGEGGVVEGQTIKITNSIFKNWKIGVTDNENAQDVKSVTLTDNTFTNASVNVSAAETVTFNGNTVVGARVTITSYAASNVLTVVATGNTLDASQSNSINAANITADDAFILPVAKANGKYYFTLQNAINAVTEGTVTLVADVALDDTLTIAAGKTITLDLAGYTISQKKNQTAGYEMILNDGNLTVEDSIGGGKISYTDLGNGGNYVSNTITNRGTFTLVSGTIENLSSATVGVNGYPYVIDTSIWGAASEVVVNVKGGKLYSEGYSAIRLRADSTTEWVKVNVSGGEIVGTIEVQNTNANKNVGALTITGGKISNHATANALFFFGANGDGSGITASIAGGTFEGNVKFSSYSIGAGFDTRIISGGTFNTDISAYCAEATVITENNDGTYSVNAGLYGSGTESDPFIIDSVEDLIFFRNSVNAGETKYNAAGVYVALAADIDLAGIDWSVNIGDDCNATFDGIFDGKNHTIYNLTSTETAAKADGYICTGLFGAIYGSAVIKNLTLENVTIDTGNYVGNNVGAVVGFAYSVTGSIENVHVKGNIAINAKDVTGVGAIVGYDYSGHLTIKNCSVKGNNGSTITGAAYVGGIIGYASTNNTIENVTVKNVSITATSCAAGGVAGIVLAGSSINGATVENVALVSVHENWKNAAAAVVGTVTGTITVSNANVSNVTVNGTASNVIVGSTHADHPTQPVPAVQARIGDKYYATIAAAIEAANAGETIVIVQNLSDVAISVTNSLTITGEEGVILNNVSISGSDGIDLVVSNLIFKGNSWIDVKGAKSLTVSGVTANVAPVNTQQTNSRSAFISLGRNEGLILDLTVENCSIVASGGANPILGWATVKNVTLKGNTFGSATAHQWNSDSVKFMAIADGAVINILNNTVYSDYNGIVFGQNTTRENAYTVYVDGNTFVGGADHIWIEITGGNTCHASVNVTSDNTVNGNAFTKADIKAHTGVIKNWSSYVGVDVVLDSNGKVCGGQLAFYNNDAIAAGYMLDANNNVVVDPAYGKVAYIEVNGEKVYYVTIAEALRAAQSGDTIVMIANATLTEAINLTDMVLTIVGDYKITTNSKLTIAGDITINAPQLDTVTASASVNFKGANKVGGFSAGYYNRVITIGSGASLEITGTGRMTVGYGNTFNITGDGTYSYASLIIPGGISITGGNDAAFNVTDAYVQIGSTSSKNSAANGTFTFNFTNSKVEFTNQFTLAEPTSGMNPTFNVNIKDSVVTTATKFIIAAPNSNVVIDNSTVTATTYVRNSGNLTLTNGSTLTASTIQFGENGGNNGTITVDNSMLNIAASSTGHALDGKGTGKIVLKNGATANVDYVTDMAISIDATSSFTGIELLGATTVRVDGSALKYGVATQVLTLTKSGVTVDATIVTVTGATVDVNYMGGVTVTKVLAGEGTEASPYLIDSAEALVYFRDCVNSDSTRYNAAGVYVALAADIDLAGIDWSVNIGDDCNFTFDGIFDGKDHTIKNLTSIETAQKADGYICAGLFGAISGSAVIKNLTLENVNINTGDYTSHNVGAVVGFAYNATGSIENVHVKGNITINAAKVDGTGIIVGYAYGGKLTIADCSVIGNDGSAVIGQAFVGGIVGYAGGVITISNTTIENVTISATSCCVGGIAGIVLGGGSVTDATVNDVALSAAHENWQNSAAVVVGTISGGAITVANATVSGTTVNGTASNVIVGSEYAEHPTEPVPAIIVRVGDRYFTDLQTAINEANGTTVVLLAPLTIKAGETVTIDLKGQTVVYNGTVGATEAMIVNKGTLTINDTVGGGTLSYTTTAPSANNAYASNTISNYGTITINGGVIANYSVGSACYALDNYAGSTATITGGTLYAKKTAVRIFNWTNGDAAKVTLTVNGGLIISEDGYGINVNSGNAPAVELNINGGAITTGDTDYNLAVYIVNKGTAENLKVNVKGGTFGGYFALNGVTSTTMKDGAVSISGGTFEGIICYGVPAYGFVSGGTYNEAIPENFCAEGYIPAVNTDGTYGVKVGAYVARNENTGVGYETIAEAIKAAQAGETVTIYAGTYNESLNVNKAITVVGEGKNLVNFNGKLNVTANGATVKNLNFTNSGTACYVGAKDVLIEGCTLVGSNGLYQSYTSGKVTFKDSTITGGTYGIHFDGNAGGEIVIDNCVITGWTSFAKSIKTVTMTDTKFEKGNYNYVRFYQENVVIDGCTFNENMAVDLAVSGATVIVENTTLANGNVEDLFEGADMVSSSITVDGEKLVRVAKIGGTYYETIAQAMNAAQAGDTVTILAGTYNESLNVNKAITVVGATDATGNLVNFNGKLNITANGATVKNLNFNNSGTACYVGAKDVLIEGCTLVGSNGLYQSYTSGTVTFKDSTITGGTYGIHFDGSAGGEIVIDNCVITGWTSFAKSIKKVTMTDTKFENGNYNFIRFYQENVVIDGCTFNKNMKVDFSVNGATATVTNSTLENGNVEDLFYGSDMVNSTITVDGEKLVRVAKIGGTYYETVAEAFAAAQAGNEVEILVAGTYSLSGIAGKNITVTGAVDGVVFDNIGAFNMGGANVTFNNVTFDYYPNVNYTGLQHSGNLVYNNCTFNGQVFLYGNSETFNGCTFNQTSADAYNVWTYGAKKVAFNDCTFNSAGKSVLIYAESASVSNEVSVTNSTFNATSAVAGKAAIEMDSSLTAGITLTIDAATTATGFGTGNVSGNSLWNNKKGNNTDANNDITVTVGGATVLAPITFVAKIGDVGYTTIAQAMNATQAGDTVTIYAGTYNENLNVNKSITVVGETDATGNLVNFNGKLNVTADGATVKNLNFNNGSSSAGYIGAKDVLIEGCTVVGGNGFRSCYTSGKVTFKDSTITGSTYGIHFDGSAGGEIVIDNCTITGWTSFAGTISKVTLTNTTFAEGNYNQLRLYQNSVITGCTFNENMTIDFGKDDVKANFNNCNVENGGDLIDVIYLGDIVNMGVDVTIDNEPISIAAKIGDSYYRTVAEAIAAATAGQTVTLLADCTGTIAISKGIVLDGADKTLTGSIDITGTGNVTIQNLNVVGSIGETNAKKGSVTIKNCTFDGQGTAGYAITLRTGGQNITIEDCSAENYAYGFLYVPKSSNIITVKNVSIANVTTGFRIDTCNSAIFEKVTITNASVGISMKSNMARTVTVKGCDINATTPFEVRKDTNGAVTTFKLEGANDLHTENLNLGQYGKLASAVRIGNVYYGSTVDAITAAQDGDTLVIVTDITVDTTKTMTVDGNYAVLNAICGKSITVDLNGKTLYAKVQEGQQIFAFFATDEGGHLTLVDTSADKKGTVKMDANEQFVYSLLMNYEPGCSITVNGGNYVLDQASDSLLYSGCSYNDNEGIRVNDGYFELGNVGVGTNGMPWIFNCLGKNERNAFVTGGTFNFDVNHQHWAHEVVVPVTKALQNNGDGTWTVVDAVAYVVETVDNSTREVGYATLAEAVASKYGTNVVLLKNITLADGEFITIAKGETVTIDLAGHTITGKDTTEKNFGLFQNNGTLTINDSVGTGKITVSATTNSGWNRYSAVISNNPGGTLTVNGGTIEHLGGTDMAYGIDSLTNGNLGNVSVTINGGTIKSVNKAVFFHDPSAKANLGTITIGANATINGDVYLFVTANSTKWPVEVAISATAMNGEVISANVPATYVVANVNGTYGVVDAVASVDGVGYVTLDEAFAAAQSGDEVTIYAAGTYALNTSGKDITITAVVDGVVFDNIGKKNMGGANVTFNNVTFDYYPNVNYTGLQHSGDLVYNNCTFNGQVFLYGNSETFNGCTFNQTSADAYNVWTYGAKKVAFNDCTFNSAGKSVLIYAESASISNEVSVTNSTFNATSAVAGKAAIEMDSSLTAGITLTIDAATTATGFGTGNVSGNSLWNNKKGNVTDANNDITVVVDGTTVLAPLALIAKIGNVSYTSFADALAAAKAGDEIVLLADVEATETFKIEKAITLDLNGKTVTTTAKKAFEVYANFIVNGNGGKIVAAQRAIDTRAAVELKVTGVTLEATSLTYGNAQPLTIGGSENGTKVTLSGVTINAGDYGYAIISFVKTELTVENSTLNGYSAIYMKSGSANSEITLKATTINAIDTTPDNTDTFAAIVFEDSNVTLTADAASKMNASSTIAFGTNSNALTGITIVFAGDIVTKAFNSGVNASNNTITVKADYTKTLLAEGYLVTDAGNGLVTLAGYAVVSVYDANGKILQNFDDLQDAIDYLDELIVNGTVTAGKITMIADVKETSIVVFENITLDLAGHTLETRHLVVFKDGYVVDSANTGLIKCAMDRVIIESEFHNEIAQMPIYDQAAGGYRMIDTAFASEYAISGTKVVYRSAFYAMDTTLITNLQNNDNLSIVVRLSWTKTAADNTVTTYHEDIILSEEMIAKVVGDAGSSSFQVTLYDYAKYENLTFQTIAMSGTEAIAWSAITNIPASSATVSE